MPCPQEMKEMKRWVCYRLVPNPDGGKPKKMPVDPVTGKNAKCNDITTWSDYPTAVEAVEKYGYSGLGFMFIKDDGFVGVDIDHCYDPETGTFNETAEAILARQPTYTEFSPSGDGVHLWFRGTKPEGASKNTETGVEMYDSSRYFTVTENTLPDALPEIAEDQDTLAWIHENFIAKKPKEKKAKKKAVDRVPHKMSDEELLDKALSAKSGENFAKLWRGEWEEHFSSQSEADFALCRSLAFWSGKDKEQMDRLFRHSGLFREKWDEKHSSDGTTYGDSTLNKAIECTDNIYSPCNNSPVLEIDGAYFRILADGSLSDITNFVIRPVEMVVTEEEVQLTADLVTTKNETFRLSFMTTDLASAQKFKNLLSARTISLVFYGNDRDLEYLKDYISELDWVRKTGVKALGIYGHEGRPVFVSPEGSIDAKGAAVDSIVQLEKYGSIKTDILSRKLLTVEQLKTLGGNLLSYNEPAKTASILGWTAGCFLKAHLRSRQVKYPHLFLIGEAGSGKSTTLERVILPVFSSTKVTASGQVTPFTLMKEAASSNTVPLALDEFKPSKLDRFKINALYNHFRDAYDGHDGVRGRPDQTMLTYRLLAPLVVAGEETADEAAIRERSIELLFSKKDLKKAEYRGAFRRIASGLETLGDFGRTLLSAGLSLSPETVKSWHEEGLKQFSAELPSRVVNNLACCFCGLKLVEKVCEGYGLRWDEVFPIPFASCVKYLERGAQDYLLDGGNSNRSIVEQTFEIMSRMQLDPKTEYMLNADHTVLYIRLNLIYDRFTKYRKDYAITGEVLPYAQFKKQLMYSDVFLQANVQKKFGTQNAKCWAIDFDLLRSRCDVSGLDSTEIVPLT